MRLTDLNIIIVSVFKVDLKQPYLSPIEELFLLRLTQLADSLNVTRCDITALVTCSSGLQKIKCAVDT